jgi:hypothetical protein
MKVKKKKKKKLKKKVGHISAAVFVLSFLLYYIYISSSTSIDLFSEAIYLFLQEMPKKEEYQ